MLCKASEGIRINHLLTRQLCLPITDDHLGNEQISTYGSEKFTGKYQIPVKGTFAHCWKM